MNKKTANSQHIQRSIRLLLQASQEMPTNRLLRLSDQKRSLPKKTTSRFHPQTRNLNVTRPMDPVHIGLSLNKMPTQLDIHRQKIPVFSQESLTVQSEQRYTNFVAQLFQNR